MKQETGPPTALDFSEAIKRMTPMQDLTYIRGVGVSSLGERHNQAALLDRFAITDRRVRSIFLNGGIERRNLTLPAGQPFPVESQAELLQKHRDVGLAMAAEAITQCVERSGATNNEIRHLCCVSSTGFMIPGFSALVIEALGLTPHCSRLDIVGMGCNAGLNALSAVEAWSRVNPGKLAVMVCVEVCSAMYVVDATMRTAVANSLFGDGAGALALISRKDEKARSPRIVRFSSLIIPEAVHAMRADWDEEHGKFNFFLDADIPYVVGSNAERALSALLDPIGLSRGDVRHWIIHSGGRKVIDSVTINLGLTRYDVRHTLSVLRDFGNLSSASFLFSYDRLLAEKVIDPGDYGVLMTMGPGSTIEMSLIQW